VAPSPSSASSFRMFNELPATFTAAAPVPLQTGIAIANLAEIPLTLTMELTTLRGDLVAVSGSLTVPARGQVAKFLNELPGFSAVQSSFQGVLRISTNSSGAISVIGLRGRFNERRAFLLATTPDINEDAAA